MKKILWILLIFITMLCSCTHDLCDIPGVVVEVKKQDVTLADIRWRYEVTVSSQDRTQLNRRYHFYTNKLYQVGDTVYIGKIYNQTKDTIQ